MSCYLLSLAALAGSNVTENNLEDNSEKNISGSLAISALDKLTKKKVVVDSVVNESIVNNEAVEGNLSSTLAAEKISAENVSLPKNSTNSTPEVGKHVMANMNAGSMILSLLMVLGLIIVCAFVLKRFNLTQQSVSQLKVITSLRLGTKERVIVVQVGEKQLLLGVTGQQITLLETLAEPLTDKNSSPVALQKNILSFLSPRKM